MIRNYKEHLTRIHESLDLALKRINELAPDGVIFIVDSSDRLLGSLTDGDIRRGLMNGKTLSSPIKDFMESKPKRLIKSKYSLMDIVNLRNNEFRTIPVLDADNVVINVINFKTQKSYLPVDAVIMAGGLGSRLRPLTNSVPKPLLKVGGKSIIDYNIDRLISYGIDDFHISVRYLGEQIENHIQERLLSNVNIEFIWEKEALGTIGAVSLIENFRNDYILITNSDLLTTLDYEDFFLDFIERDADLSIATIPHEVNIPYAVLETEEDRVLSFKEKPKYSYFCNGGIYLIKKDLVNSIPSETFYNTTDLIEKLLENNMKVISYPIRGYWLDIGKPEDYSKAKKDVSHLDL